MPSNNHRTSGTVRRGTLGAVSVHVRDTAKGRRYDVKVRSADGVQHSKTFATKRAAVDYEARQTAVLADGVFIAPRAGATTVTVLAERWLTAGAKRESTRERDRSIVTNHLLPGLGATRALAKVSRADCQAPVDQWQAAAASLGDSALTRTVASVGLQWMCHECAMTQARDRRSQSMPASCCLGS